MIRVRGRSARRRDRHRGLSGNHVESLDLLTADGSIRTLSPSDDDRDLFWATVGGMGLTGIVVRARVRMKHTETAYFIADARPHRQPRRNDGTAGRRIRRRLRLLDVGARYHLHRLRSSGRAGFTRGSLATLDQLPPKLRSGSVAVHSASTIYGSRHLSERNGQPGHHADRLGSGVSDDPKHGRGTVQNRRPGG